jgi:site-specific recombinase XerD
MAAMSIYNVLRKTERFGDSFRVCDPNDAGVGSCDQFLTELSLRDCSVYTQRAYAIGLAHFFSWLHASGGDPDHVTRQIVGNYITEFARGTRQGAVSAHSAQKPRQPRTINHRLSVLASYFEYCIRRDTEDGSGPWKGRINPASGNPLTEELRHGTIGRDLPARQRQRDGFRRRIPRTLPKVLGPTAIQKLIDSAGSYRDKAILILLSRAGQRIGDWSPVAGRHGILGMELEDIDRKRRFITVRLKGTADSVWRALSSEHQKLFPTTSRCADDGTSLEIPDPQPDPANLVTEAMDSTSLVVFGQRAASLTRKRRTRAVVPEQASLSSLG